MALIAGIYSSVYAGVPVNRTAGQVLKGKTGAARRARKANRKANRKGA